MTKTVLIADDDRFTCELLKFVIESQGLRALTCQDGHELISMLRSEMVHMIFLDALMPRMDGFEALRKLDLEERTRAIPKILMTGIYKYDQIKDNLTTANLVKRVIFKPIALNLFQELVEENLSMKFSSQIFFPDPIQRKPGFEKRIDKEKMHMDLADGGKRSMLVPLAGNLAQYRFGQLLHFALNDRGSWNIDISSKIANGGIHLENGQISAYWSDQEADFQELSFRDKMARFCNGMFKRTDEGRHKWEQGPNATPFAGFLFRFATASEGTYVLEKNGIPPAGAKVIPAIPIEKLLTEMIEPPFPSALIHKHLQVAGTDIKVCGHCQPLPIGITLTEKQKKIVYLIERTSALQDILRQSDEGSADTLQIIYGLWLAGVLEIHRKIKVSSGFGLTTRRQKSIESDRDINAPQPIPIEKPDELPDRSTQVPPPDTKVAPKQPKTDHASAAHESRKAKEILHLYNLGVRAQYYDFLDVKPDCNDADMQRMLRQAKTRFIESDEILELPDDLIRKFQSLNLFVKCAAAMLGKPKSRSRYDAAITVQQPDHIESLAQQHYDIGVMYLDEQNLYRGVAELCLAIRINPAKEEAYLQLLQNTVQDPDGFAFVFDLACDAIERFPNHTDFRIVLGQCYKEIGQLEKATAEFLKVLDIDPENAEAMQHLLSVPGQSADLGYQIE